LRTSADAYRSALVGPAGLELLSVISEKSYKIPTVIPTAWFEPIRVRYRAPRQERTLESGRRADFREPTRGIYRLVMHS
jgi:hypothetical protein